MNIQNIKNKFKDKFSSAEKVNNSTCFPFVNAKKMVSDAHIGKYAIPHININNLEWAKTILLAAEEKKSPIILGASEGAIKYMGGFNVVAAMTGALVKDLGITVPVVLHLDHGSFEGVKKALEAGFSSVMYDGSHETFDINYENTKKVIEIAKNYCASVEAEVGTIGGEEDGIVGDGEIASPEEALKFKELGIDFLAAGIGNIHGPYPKEWKTLNFDALKNISETVNIGLVLHGGSGIPKDQIKKAISLGISKININTELQQANAEGIKKFVISGEVDKGKNFDPRKLYSWGVNEMKETVIEKIIELGSENKA
ncbi:MAG: class II fructose-1,6-bisphosphate aldolase [Metamycoplasmataceae bacterium]